jgi:hypothetical protein
MSKEVEVITNEDGSTQVEVPIPSFTSFDAEKLNVSEFFNFDEMRRSLEFTKDGFTVHPYPNSYFSPISIHDTLAMWKIDINYYCPSNDSDCVIDVYTSALRKIDSEIKKNLGEEWGIYLMPDGYNLAIIHNYDIMIKKYNKLIEIDIKNHEAKQRHQKIREAASRVLAAKNTKGKK